jgi:hypothetical protein
MKNSQERNNVRSSLTGNITSHVQPKNSVYYVHIQIKNIYIKQMNKN